MSRAVQHPWVPYWTPKTRSCAPATGDPPAMQQSVPHSVRTLAMGSSAPKRAWLARSQDSVTRAGGARVADDCPIHAT